MSDRQKIRIPAILGPTAVGKTELCLRLATELQGEIISCDSRQIYRHMDIGTAKPSREEQARVRHWLIDIIDPSDAYSAYQFSEDTLRILRQKSEKSVVKILCGGTGLYFQSLCEGVGPQVASDPDFREACKRKAAEKGNDVLYRELQRCDPKTAARLHPNDVQRVIRALQVFHETGKPLTDHLGNKKSPGDCVFRAFVLMSPREELYNRINRRVDQMMAAGLWEEFQSIRKKGYTREDPGMHCVGYKELFPVEKGIWSLSDAVEKIKKNSRHYAKRQITWFKNKTIAEVVDITQPDAFQYIKDKVCRFIEG